ncbi:MAG: hypothetical protein AB7H71_04855 [Alphaproteobacteria bacterium]
MQRPAFWLMKDPLANPRFQRAWVLPSPLERKNPGALSPGQIFGSDVTDILSTAQLTKAQARALVEQLFGSGSSA